MTFSFLVRDCGLICKSGRSSKTLICQDTPAHLEAAINGTVWQVTATDDAQLEKYQQYKISNMQRDEQGVTLRLIAPEQPGPNAVPLAPNLEDVFLTHFGEGGV